MCFTLKREKEDKKNEIAALRREIAEMQSDLVNKNRDSDTTQSLKNMLQTSSENQKKLANEKSKLLDEFAAERVELAKEMDTLKNRVDLDNEINSNQKIEIAKLQTQVNSQQQKHRELEINNHKLTNALNIQQKDLEMEQQHGNELTAHLRLTTEKNKKIAAKAHDLKQVR